MVWMHQEKRLSLVVASGDEEVAVRGEVYRADTTRVCLDAELHVASADRGHHDRPSAKHTQHHQRPHNPHLQLLLLKNSVTHSLSNIFIYSHSLTHSFTPPLTHQFTHSLTHESTLSLMHSFTHSSIHSHSFIHFHTHSSDKISFHQLPSSYISLNR